MCTVAKKLQPGFLFLPCFSFFHAMKDPEWMNAHHRRLERENGFYLRRLKKKNPRGLDLVVRETDAEVFAETDCLECANCCKTISPVFRQRDITRLSSVLGLSESAFYSKYLHRDSDGDHVLHVLPCPFLGEGNRCAVYEFRPDACRGYPHTGSLPFTGNSELMIRNSAVCPAVHEMIQRLKQKYPL